MISRTKKSFSNESKQTEEKQKTKWYVWHSKARLFPLFIFFFFVRKSIFKIVAGIRRHNYFQFLWKIDNYFDPDCSLNVNVSFLRTLFIDCIALAKKITFTDVDRLQNYWNYWHIRIQLTIATFFQLHLGPFDFLFCRCWSNIGKVNEDEGYQEISIGYGCSSKGGRSLK